MEAPVESPFAKPEFHEQPHETQKDITIQHLQERFPELDFSTLRGEHVEFEIEKESEQRIYVLPRVDETYFEWPNTIEDTYGPEGDVRVRTKNGTSRVSLKTPIGEEDTPRTKACWRVEIKAPDQVNQSLFESFKELFVGGKHRRVEKRGSPHRLTDGTPIWVNHDRQKDAYYIEIDIPMADEETYMPERFLPDYLEYLGHQRYKGKEAEPVTKEAFQEQFLENNEVLSRTTKGKIDTSVSPEKKAAALVAEEVQKTAERNLQTVAEQIWDLRDRAIGSVEELKSIFLEVAAEVNKDLGDLSYRTWEVPYGRKVAPDQIEMQMQSFFEGLFNRIQMLRKGNADPYTIAAWTEWETNAGIHAFKDGCGRISRAWSGIVLALTGTQAPKFDSRDNYNGAMNKGFFDFVSYYKESAGFY